MEEGSLQTHTGPAKIWGGGGGLVRVLTISCRKRNSISRNLIQGQFSDCQFLEKTVLKVFSIFCSPLSPFSSSHIFSPTAHCSSCSHVNPLLYHTLTFADSVQTINKNTVFLHANVFQSIVKCVVLKGISLNKCKKIDNCSFCLYSVTYT